MNKIEYASFKIENLKNVMFTCDNYFEVVMATPRIKYQLMHKKESL